jgi:hypothetical protein
MLHHSTARQKICRALCSRSRCSDSAEGKCRDARGIGLIEDIISDSRYALRSFRKSPSLVLVIVASLALGIGANTAIFSVMNAVSLKMLPVRDPERLVLLNWSLKLNWSANNATGGRCDRTADCS